MKARTSYLSRCALWLAGSVLVLVVVAELVSRFVLGLGTPPLYEADAGFEYRLLPNQDVRRFGNHIQVNRWGMRSPDFGNTKTDPQELRVMVFGDSVVNGGSQIDQAALSTSLLQSALQTQMVRPVTVGNISAGSWGPGNWLAYADRFGFFEADVVVLVVGSGDHADNPVFAPLDADHPSQAPTLALQEAVLRYLPRYLNHYLPEALGGLWKEPSEGTTATRETNLQDRARGQADLQQFLQLAQGRQRHAIVLHHPDLDELTSGSYADGHAQMQALVQGMSLPFVELRTVYQAAGSKLYRDNIHHSAQGQQVMAGALLDAVLKHLPIQRAEPVDVANAAQGSRP
ncbi:MAG: hypothetical protein DCF26_02705 [Burkholderiales bacterium]|nr:MAG: hypothetical protein DCF26_02705 [Burkholderiales bacterium]